MFGVSPQTLGSCLTRFGLQTVVTLRVSGVLGATMPIAAAVMTSLGVHLFSWIMGTFCSWSIPLALHNA